MIWLCPRFNQRLTLINVLLLNTVLLAVLDAGIQKLKQISIFNRANIANSYQQINPRPHNDMHGNSITYAIITKDNKRVLHRWMDANILRLLATLVKQTMSKALIKCFVIIKLFTNTHLGSALCCLAVHVVCSTLYNWSTYSPAHSSIISSRHHEKVSCYSPGCFAVLTIWFTSPHTSNRPAWRPSRSSRFLLSPTE